MAMFTIDDDHSIIAYPTPEAAQDAQALGAQAFTSQKELAKLAADWPARRLAEIWNGFAGTAGFDDLKPTKRFTDRKTAVARIWQAVQRLAPAADGGAQGVPEVAAASKEATVKKNAPRTTKGAKRTNKAKPEAREGSKSSIILGMIAKGATLGELMAAAGWQAHSVRGFLSTAAKKQGLTIESRRNKDGERLYKLAK